MQQPALFVSHGAPSLALEPGPARDFFITLGDALSARYGRPQAVVVASAHNHATQPRFDAAPRHATVHDFYGFAPELYACRYDAPGAPALAREASILLQQAGLSPALTEGGGLDHGAWVPLSLMYPGCDVPVLPLALDGRGDGSMQRAVGRALAPLRARGVLMLGSGSLTHNLGDLRPPGTAAPAYVQEFVAWFADRALAPQGASDFADWLAAPHARHAHPSPEHFLPALFARAAGGGQARRLFHGYDYGALAMDCYSFEGAV